MSAKTNIQPEVIKEVTLPSGANATFYRRKGIALINAQRKAGGDSSRVAFAMLSEVVEIDGKQCMMEDFDEMDLFDVMCLNEEFSSLGKSGQTRKP